MFTVSGPLRGIVVGSNDQPSAEGISSPSEKPQGWFCPDIYGVIVGITGVLLALMLENGELAIEVLVWIDIMGGYG